MEMKANLLFFSSNYSSVCSIFNFCPILMSSLNVIQLLYVFTSNLLIPVVFIQVACPKFKFGALCFVFSVNCTLFTFYNRGSSLSLSLSLFLSLSFFNHSCSLSIEHNHLVFSQCGRWLQELRSHCHCFIANFIYILLNML